MFHVLLNSLIPRFTFLKLFDYVKKSYLCLPFSILVNSIEPHHFTLFPFWKEAFYFTEDGKPSAKSKINT